MSYEQWSGVVWNSTAIISSSVGTNHWALGVQIRAISPVYVTLSELSTRSDPAMAPYRSLLLVTATFHVKLNFQKCFQGSSQTYFARSVVVLPFHRSHACDYDPRAWCIPAPGNPKSVSDNFTQIIISSIITPTWRQNLCTTVLLLGVKKVSCCTVIDISKARQ